MKYAQPLKICSLMVILIVLATVIQGCAAKAPDAAQQQGTPVQLNKIEFREVDGKTEISIEGSQPILQYTSFQLSDPLRLVIDISEANVGEFRQKISVNNGAVIDITPSQMENISRLEIALAQTLDAKVNQVAGKLIVEIAKPVEVAKTAPDVIVPGSAQAAPMAVEPKQEPAVANQPEKATATVVSSVQASAGKDGVKVVISGDGTMRPNTFMVEGKKLVVDIPGVKSRVKPSVIPVRKGGLNRVRVGQHQEPDQKVRVVLDLTKPLEYTITPEGNSLVIAMHAATSLKTKVNTEVGEITTETKIEDKVPQERSAQAPEKEAVVEKESMQPQEAPTVAPPQVIKERVEPAKREMGTPETALLAGGSKYTGKKISLDLQDADLVNVMRLFADVANLNIILAPDVKGKVTVRMVNIPWDQAMDIILKMNGLGYALEDNVLRIAAVSALTKEAEDEMKSKEAKKKVEELVTRMVAINYATASDIEGTIKKSLSSRGETVTDVRTNTIIIKDIARNVDEAISLVRLLDKRNAQIMIEARIVEASLSFSRSLGVQWGGSQKFDAGHGNPIGASFPNSATITGGPSMGATASGSGNYFVNMPAAAGPGAGGAIGFSFGSINKALNLDLVLSALESTGEGKVISTPRISALDNKPAKISQGVTFFVQTTSATGGPASTSVTANLALEVTPQVTSDNKIFLKISASKNAADFSLLGAGGNPSVRTNEAKTEILLSDGETAVIGGILIMDRGQSVSKVPFFGDIPILGWFFRSTSTREEKRELLIFVTPRVVRQEVI